MTRTAHAVLRRSLREVISNVLDGPRRFGRQWGDGVSRLPLGLPLVPQRTFAKDLTCRNFDFPSSSGSLSSAPSRATKSPRLPRRRHRAASSRDLLHQPARSLHGRGRSRRRPSEWKERSISLLRPGPLWPTSRSCSKDSPSTLVDLVKNRCCSTFGPAGVGRASKNFPISSRLAAKA